MKRIITIILLLISTTSYAQLSSAAQMLVLVENSISQLETAQEELSFAKKTYNQVKKVNNAIRTVNDIGSVIYSMKRTINSLSRLTRNVKDNRKLYDIDYYTQLINDITYFTSSLEKTAADCTNIFTDNKLTLNDGERLTELRESLKSLNALSSSISQLERATTNTISASNLNKIFL